MNREGLPPAAFPFRYSCEMATAAPRPQRDELVIEAPGTAARRISLDQERYRLGRSSTNELAFPSDPKLSREHLVFERIAEGWTVRDLGQPQWHAGQRRAADENHPAQARGSHH